MARLWLGSFLLVAFLGGCGTQEISVPHDRHDLLLGKTTPTPSATATPEPSPTGVATSTPGPTVTPTPTSTTPTATPTPTRTPTATPTATATPTPTPTSTPPSGKVYIYIRADNAQYVTLTSPMQFANGSCGNSITVPVGNSAGKATVALNIPQSGNYAAWGFILGPDDNSNSFHTSMDADLIDNDATDGSSTIWDLPITTAWRWSRVSKRTGSYGTSADITYNLSAGSHTFFLNYREPNARLDLLLVTNDLAFVPSGNGDTEFPSVVLLAPPSGDLSGNVTFRASAADNCGFVAVRFLLNPGSPAEFPIGSELTSPTGGTLSEVVSADTLPSGTHNLVARATDSNGNSSLSSSVSVRVVDSTQPSVAISASPQTPRSTDRVTYTASASDPSGIEQLSIFIVGASNPVATCTYPNASTCQYQEGPYPNGTTKSFYAIAIDHSSNRNTATSPTQSLTVDDNQSNFNVIAYYTQWSVCDMPPQDVDWDAITHLIYFPDGPTEPTTTAPYWAPSYDANAKSTWETGVPQWCPNQTPGKTHQDIIREKAAQHGVKLIMCVGGQYGTEASNFSAIIADTSPGGKQDQFLNAITSFAQQQGYHGIDIDWEFPDRSATGRANYTLFLDKLRAKLDTWNPRGILTMAAPHWFWWDLNTKLEPIIDVATINRDFDFVDLMEYGMQANAVSFYSPVYQDTVDQWTWDYRGINEWVAAGVEKSKLIPLIPFEAIKMNAASSALGSPASGAQWIGLRDIPSNVLANPIYSPIAKAAYGWANGVMYAFETPQTIADKVVYARQKGVGGVGIWELWRGWLPGASPPDPLLQAIKKEALGR